jgi:hypothetical protein
LSRPRPITTRPPSYSVFDITSEIREKNALGVILGNGRHIKASWLRTAAPLSRSMEQENELAERVITDEDWKTGYGAVLENGIYLGERTDSGSNRMAGMNPVLTILPGQMPGGHGTSPVSRPDAPVG